MKKIEGYGGTEGLAELLGSSVAHGLDPAAHGHLSLESRKQTFGENSFPAQKSKSFFRLFYENLKDPTLILLMAAAMVRPSMQLSDSVANTCFPEILWRTD